MFNGEVRIDTLKLPWPESHSVQHLLDMFCDDLDYGMVRFSMREIDAGIVLHNPHAIEFSQWLCGLDEESLSAYGTDIICRLRWRLEQLRDRSAYEQSN